MEFSIRRKIDDTGRIVIPRDIRKSYNIKSGDTLVFIAEKDGFSVKIVSKTTESEAVFTKCIPCIKNQAIPY